MYDLSLEYTKDIVGVPFSITYTNDDSSIKASIQLVIPTVTKIQTSAISTASTLWVQDITNANSVTNTLMSWSSANVQNSVFSPLNSGGVIVTTFNYLLNA